MKKIIVIGAGGHGGGDEGIMIALRDALNGEYVGNSICTIEQTCRNHLISFAAEESRLTGRVVEMAELEARMGGIE